MDSSTLLLLGIVLIILGKWLTMVLGLYSVITPFFVPALETLDTRASGSV